MKREEPKLLSMILDEYVKRQGLDEGIERVQIFDAWSQAVGPKAAAATSNTFFRDGTLFCTISSSIIRNQLYFQLDLIKEKINSLFDDSPVRSIVLK